MKIENQELAAVAAATAPRFDMYVGIHKALRPMMTDALLALGRMDPDDAAEVAARNEAAARTRFKRIMMLLSTT